MENEASGSMPDTGRSDDAGTTRQPDHASERPNPPARDSSSETRPEPQAAESESAEPRVSVWSADDEQRAVTATVASAEDDVVDPPRIESSRKVSHASDESEESTDQAPGDESEEPVEEAAADGSVEAAGKEADEDEDGEDEEPAPEPRVQRPLPRIMAVANQKGGVGKTTTTVNLAACLAEQGFRTLLVDLDPQANASTGLGLDPRSLEHSVYHVMLHNADADSCIEPTEVKNLFVLPSSLDLAGAEIELVAMMSREHRLRMAIESVIDDYDYVLIDCPPSLGLLTVNALTAAKEVLVPIQCEYYALEGLGQLMRNVELVKANLNPKLEISHIVLVMFDPRTKLAGQVVDEVRGHFGDRVCANVIPRTVRLSEAPSFGQPITTFDSESRGAAAYRAVAVEVLNG